MGLSGYLCLRINGNKLNFDDINSGMKLQPTQVYHKGDIISSKYGNKVHTEEGWFYEVGFDGSQNLNDVVNEFVSTLSNCKSYLKVIYNDYYVRLWCDIYSDFAQLSMIFTPDTIQKIADLGIGFDIQLYSHGELSE